MGAIGGASGALLGGILTEALSWRWILIINVPIGLVGALAALHVVRAGAARRGRDARLRPRRRAVGDARARGADLRDRRVRVARLGLGAHAADARRRAPRCSPSSCSSRAARHAPARAAAHLRVARLSGANVVVFCLGGSVFAMWYFLSLYLQQVLGYSPIEAGLAFLPMPLTIAACTQAATRLTGRFGPGPVLAGGMTLIAAGMLLFTGVAPDGTYAADVLVPSLLCAAGHRLLVRPVDDRGHDGRAAQRGRAGLRPGQHLAADGRLARPRAARDRGDAAHGRPGRRGPARARRSPRASTARSRSAPASRWPARSSACWCSAASVRRAGAGPDHSPSSSNSCSQISLRVGKAGTAWRRRVDRHLADDGDRRRVQEVGDLGAGDRRADEHAALLVDEEAARAARVAAVERAAGVARRLDVDDARRRPGVRGRRVVWPTAATCGSVKITRGASGPSAPCSAACPPEHVVGGDRGLVLRHVRERRAAVEVADHVEPVAARGPGSARRPRRSRRRSSPTVSSPSPSTCGVRPTATSSSSPVTWRRRRA